MALLYVECLVKLHANDSVSISTMTFESQTFLSLATTGLPTPAAGQPEPRQPKARSSNQRKKVWQDQTGRGRGKEGGGMGRR